ncbi:MAG: hypothetical protein HY748_09700 [Elusimicrobia bacterium]|nr:hypothetical protein [Elusimicrobiota bacterium]
MKKVAVLAALAVLAGFGLWRFKLREPPDLSEAEARAIADKELLDFCRNSEATEAIYPYFAFKGRQPSADARFRWSFHYLDDHADPWQKVVVSVGKKGDRNLEFSSTPAPDGAAASTAAPPAESAPQAAGPAEGAPPGSPGAEAPDEAEGEPAASP